MTQAASWEEGKARYILVIRLDVKLRKYYSQLTPPMARRNNEV